MNFTILRAYEEPDPSGGTRVRVDRLWPRGSSGAAVLAAALGASA